MLVGGLDDQDPNDWDDEECKNAGDVNIPVAILCSGDSDDEQDLPSILSEDGSEEEDDGEDSEKLDRGHIFIDQLKNSRRGRLLIVTGSPCSTW